VLAIEKIAGSGIEIAGVGSLPGMTTVITNAIGLTGSSVAVERAGRAFNAAGVITAGASAIAMISSLSASGTMSPSPLERNKERRQGKDATVTVTISFDAGATGTAAEVACAANVVGRAVGSEISVPIEGTPISGADVKFDAGKNIPTKVQFNAGSVNSSTGSDGSVSIPVTGVARKKDLPESARQIDDTFGVRISAQVEGPSLQAMLDIFLSGLSTGKAPIAGPLGAAINVAKTIRWDLGEITFPMKDWEADSYRIDQPFGVLKMTGVVCDLAAPFAITIGGEINGSIVLTPSSPDGGQYAGGAPDVFLVWEGTYIVDRSNPDQPVIKTTPTKEQIEPPAGPALSVGEFWANGSVNLVRDESACTR
jgi:hypothetical protein